jgi:hypothetical protein
MWLSFGPRPTVDTFLKTPDSVLERIDQLAVEFHGADKPHYLDVVKKLKRIFYIANLPLQ